MMSRDETKEKRRAAVRGQDRVRRDGEQENLLVDCQTQQDRCLLLTCNITEIGATSSFDIIYRIEGALDERFYEVEVIPYWVELWIREGGRIEKTITSKGLMHSNDHIKGN